MKRLSLPVAAVVALSACASVPRGPPLTYEQLLPNTHENPVWARNVAQPTVQEPTSAPQSPAPSAPR